jgi:integral membrane protein (TIGR01906 family)
LRILGIAAKWLFILCLPILLLTASIGWAVNSHWLYKHGSEKYNVSQSLADSGLELTDSELEEVYAGLVSYFNSSDEDVSLTVIKDGEPFNLFTPEETIHFRDVKGLIWLDYWLLLGTGIYVLAYAGVSLFWHRRQHWRWLAWGLVGGSGLTLALMLALGLGTLFGFDELFYQFHLLFFSNEFWSAEGYMLLLFPEDFFYDAALFCALATTIGAVVLGGVAGGYLKITK